MKKILFASLFALILSSGQIMADNSNILDENGIRLSGYCKAIASSSDGYTYVLMKDKRLIRIDIDGEQKEYQIPLDKEILSQDDYFCDMAVDTKAAYFVGYNYSSIQALDLNNPKQLKTLPLKFENKPIKPMMISKTSNGWCIKDFDLRTFMVDSKGNLSLLPQNSNINLDKNGKPLMLSNPILNKEGITEFPNKVLNEDNSVKWDIPENEFNKPITNIEYLGYANDQDNDIYLIRTSKGELNVELFIVAVNSKKEIVARKPIPVTNLDFMMRFCKLVSDGSVIAAYGDAEKPDDIAIIKRFELKGKEPDQAG
jgi:hypothetical protein